MKREFNMNNIIKGTNKKIFDFNKMGQRVKSSLKFTYLMPLVVFMCIFKIWPFIQIVIVSFKENYNYLTKDYSGIGVENYVTVLSDSYFLQAVGNTFLYTVLVVVITNLIALPVSWCLYTVKKFASFFQTSIFLPFVTTNIAIGMAWRIIFNEKGVLNSIITALGFDAVSWLSDSSVSLTTLVIYGVWSNIPFTVLLYLSFLLGIDKNILISAEADGTREMKIFTRIVLPMMLPTIIMTTIINSISSWLEVNALFPLFSGDPGPYYDLYTMVYYVYSKMQKGVYSFGIACASSILLFVCIGVFMLFRVLAQRKKKAVE